MCGCNEKTLIRKFNNKQSYYWRGVMKIEEDRTEVCIYCGSDKFKQEEKVKESEVE